MRVKRTYHVVVTKEEGKGYVGRVVEWPGVRANAKTRAEVKTKVRKALEQELLAKGEPLAAVEFVAVDKVAVTK